MVLRYLSEHLHDPGFLDHEYHKEFRSQAIETYQYYLSRRVTYLDIQECIEISQNMVKDIQNHLV